MIKISAQVMIPDGAGIQVLVNRATCEGCRSSCSGPGILLVLPGYSAQDTAPPLHVEAGQLLQLGLQERDRQRLLWHSLLLPLVGMLTGTLLAALVNPGDLPVLLGATLGFCLGLAACKPYSSNTLHIQEA
jgi:positive regulator of sigma E activity